MNRSLLTMLLRRDAWCVLLLLVIGHAGDGVTAEPTTRPPAGLRENTPQTHALVGARIVTAPGQVIEQGTLVIRDGVITAVGDKVDVPADARVWDLAGKTLYPGFLDAYSERPEDPNASRPAAGAPYWNRNVTPDLHVDRDYRPDLALNEKLRSQGITARLIAPVAGIIKGASALVTTGDVDGTQSILRERTALHVKLTPPRDRSRDDYPTSPMGTMTLVRQAFYDARWHRDAWDHYTQQSGTPRPERNDALAALGDYLDGAPVVIDAYNVLYLLRADQVANEFKLNAIVRGAGDEYQLLDAVKATGRAVLVPLDFPQPPDVRSPEKALAVRLDRLMHWDLAPENPKRLDEAGVKIAFMTHGLAEPGKFLPAVRKAVERGLKPDAALRALTLAPAELLGVDRQVGTLAVGKAANVVVTDGDLFDRKTKLLETWVDGRRYTNGSEPFADVRGTWEVTLTKPDGAAETLVVKISGDRKKLSGSIKRGEKETKFTRVTLEGAQLDALLKGESLDWSGMPRISATLLSPKEPQAAKAAEPPTWQGAMHWSDGSQSTLTARHTAIYEAKADEPEEDADKEKDAADDDKPKKKADDKSLPALYEVNYPFGAYGVARPPEQPATVLFEHATVWTCGPEGKLDDASVLVERGKVIAVGRDLLVPKDAVVVDARGKHITPGIIDCHSHIATDGGVNETGQTITAEVRIGDFIEPRDINLYRQLACGVTAANILHGSANTIGGQNQVIKFLWGSLPEALKFPDAPPGIKFALGENVKQSNWGERYRTRYPQSRMGVEQLVRDAFMSAIEYRGKWVKWREKKQGPAPRVDLELEALSEVLAGQRKIHCHSYRQDEILALIRVCQEFNVHIATLQHVLEGYKVADEIAKQNIGASSFSDWWTYKVEVLDAIPYNGAMLRKAGVITSFNSDNAELARHLNLEAAKAVKYGEVPEVEALKFVTLNPARQLGIDQQVGSLEVGKDATLVVWSGPPLSTMSICEQTWIDGRRYFDRAEDRQRQQRVNEMRAALIDRVLASGQDPATDDDADKKNPWPTTDIFCPHCAAKSVWEDE